MHNLAQNHLDFVVFSTSTQLLHTPFQTLFACNMDYINRAQLRLQGGLHTIYVTMKHQSICCLAACLIFTFSGLLMVFSGLLLMFAWLLPFIVIWLALARPFVRAICGQLFQSLDYHLRGDQQPRLDSNPRQLALQRNNSLSSSGSSRRLSLNETDTRYVVERQTGRVVQKTIHEREVVVEENL